MKGRKPTPSALLKARGSFRADRHNANEPKAKAEAPSCPAHLSVAGRREWRRISKELVAARVLTKLDRAALAAYCQSYGRWIEAEKEIVKTGLIVRSPSGFPLQNPYLSIANKAIVNMIKIAAEFGLTPSSRTRIKVEPEKQESGKEKYFRIAR